MQSRGGKNRCVRGSHCNSGFCPSGRGAETGESLPDRFSVGFPRRQDTADHSLCYPRSQCRRVKRNRNKVRNVPIIISQKSFGSGVVVSYFPKKSLALIITNLHVVADSYTEKGVPVVGFVFYDRDIAGGVISVKINFVS